VSVSPPAPRAWTRWDAESELAALQAGLRLVDLAGDRGLTLDLLVALHKLLLPPSHRHWGRLRDQGAVIRLEGVLHRRAPPPDEAARQAEAALEWLNRELAEPVVDDAPALAGELMFRLTEAHPFMDGNGRVALTLVTWLLLRADFVLRGDPIPYCRSRKPELYRALAGFSRPARGSPPPLDWTRFFEEMVRSCFEAPPRR
jgi:fido (protein-threonine AMPylation protein)